MLKNVEDQINDYYIKFGWWSICNDIIIDISQKYPLYAIFKIFYIYLLRSNNLDAQINNSIFSLLSHLKASQI